MKYKLKLVIAICVNFFFSVSFSQTPFFSQDFQSGFAIPTNWTQTHSTSSTGWKFGYYSAIQSQYFPIPAHTKFAGTNDDKCNCDESIDYLITPSIDMSSYSKVFLKFAYFFGEATANSQKEEATVEVSADNGVTWDIVDMLAGVTVWTDYTIDISQYAGQSNVKIAFHYNDNGEWMYGLAIDDVKLFQPYQYDLSVTSLDLDDFVPLSTIPIKGSYYNYGSNTLTTLTINWQVDTDMVKSSTLNSLNILPLSSYNFTHSINWTPTIIGSHAIRVWISDLNSNTDQNPTNDTIAKTLDVVSAMSQRICLMEEFTNASCGPCAAQNPALHSKLNTNKGKIGVIKYQTSFPGVDPMYSYNPTVPDNRQDYYGVSGVPTLFMDGISINGTAGYDGSPANLTQSMIDDQYAKGSLFNILVKEVRNGSDVSIHIEITPLYKINVNDVIAHVVIVEDEINYTTAPGTNGEKNFYWISRKMLPSTNGTVIGPLEEGVVKTVDVNYTLDPIYNAGRLSNVVFIQNNTTHEVYQSIMTKWDGTTQIEKNMEREDEINIYPNPLQSSTDISFNVVKSGLVDISVSNQLGQKVFNFSRTYIPGTFTIKMDLSRYPSGIYNLQFKTSEKLVNKKLVLTK